MSYPEHSLVGSYSSAEMQSVYFIAPAEWTEKILWNDSWNLGKWSLGIKFKLFTFYFCVAIYIYTIFFMVMVVVGRGSELSLCASLNM